MIARHWSWPRARLFGKVFLACWLTAGLTGLCLTAVSHVWPSVLLPPMPDAPRPSWMAPLVIGAGLALLASGLIAWQLSRAVRLLRHALSEVAQGNLSVRLSASMGTQRDEIGELGRHFDGMVQRLQDLMGAQRRLLHDVSHELRSPLARMHALIGLAAHGQAQQADTFARLEHEVERLDALVGEVLTLARLEAAVAPVAWAPVNVLALLHAVADGARFEAEVAGKGLVVHVEHAVALDWTVIAHAESLYRALDNVLRNAVRYTAKGSEVEVRASRSGPDLVVRVADRGPGVPGEALARMFEPFVRVHASQGHDRADGAPPQAPQGFGLGLAIARSALDLHGGAISAQAREGGGLEVAIRLPWLRCGVDADAPALMASGLSRSRSVKK